MVPLRIAHLSFSSSGGAGGVASRLAAWQRDQGYDAQVFSAISGSLRDQPLKTLPHTLAAAVDHYVVKKPHFLAPISLYRDRLSTPLRGSLDGFDIIHLHWHHGLVDLRNLASIAEGRPVVWTLHDMAPFTSVCHYHLGNSPCFHPEGPHPVRRMFHSAAASHLRTKKESIASIADLRLVSPSHWLASLAETSAVFADRRVTVIPNPLPELPAPPVRGEDVVPTSGEVEPGEVTFGIVAADTRDRLKAVTEGVAGFTAARRATGRGRLLIAGRHPQKNQDGIQWLGLLDRAGLERLYASCDYLIVPSHAENQPLIMSEAQAHGVSVIARNSTGLPEHLDIDPEGALFDSIEELTAVLRALTSTRRTAQSRRNLGDRAAEKFNPDHVGEAYLAVYEGQG